LEANLGIERFRLSKTKNEYMRCGFGTTTCEKRRRRRRRKLALMGR
jgi:hypothetical protein